MLERQEGHCCELPTRDKNYHKEYQEAIGKILYLALWNCLISNIQVMKRLRTLKTICSPIFLIDIIHMEAHFIK
jgi:hypothetical protein